MRVLAVILLAGCAVVDSQPGDGSGSGSAEPDPNLTTAERTWVREALPVLMHQCGICHATTATAAPGFLAGDTEWEQRATMLASGVVNLDAPISSRLLTKGGHSGPSMTATSASVILTWIEAESDERL